jgi:hypothetical protein
MTCQHIFSKGKRAGKKCLNYKSLHDGGESGYCGIHLKAHRRRESAPKRAESALKRFVMGAPRDTRLVPQQPAPIKRSDFALTINLNKTVDGLSERQQQMFKLISEYLFDCEGIDDFVKDMKDDGKTNIISRYIDHNFEVGEKFGKLHVHSLIQIKHDGMIQIDIPRLRAFIDDAMGYNVHINLQAIKGGGTVGDWLRYIRKKESK